MTLLLSEAEVGALLDMNEVVAAVEEAFRRKGMGEATNSPRSRSRGSSSVLNVMHASLPYLGRGGIKGYMASRSGTKFVVILYDSATSQPLAVMGADLLGRFRTGAASGVATKHMYRERSCTLALFGSGKQALTQALAVSSILRVESVRVWSPDEARRERFAGLLSEHGMLAKAFPTPGAALEGAQVASAITSSKNPFLTRDMILETSHVNLCGGNVPEHAELAPEAVPFFGTVAVDDLVQAKLEYGELIQAAEAGAFQWRDAVELGAVVAGRSRPEGATLFKSGGVAIEDVAVASVVYDKAIASRKSYASADLV